MSPWGWSVTFPWSTWIKMLLDISKMGWTIDVIQAGKSHLLWENSDTLQKEKDTSLGWLEWPLHLRLRESINILFPWQLGAFLLFWACQGNGIGRLSLSIADTPQRDNEPGKGVLFSLQRNISHSMILIIQPSSCLNVWCLWVAP